MDGAEVMERSVYPLVKLCAALALAAFSPFSVAGAIEVQQLSAFLYADEFGSSLEMTELGYYRHDDFTGSDLDVAFSSSLDNDNLGKATWTFTNHHTGPLTNARLFLFLDASIDESQNAFFNESGSLSAVNGTGATDQLADSWEIDEPGYLFGDIFNHILQGDLDNSNGVPAGLEDDVSLALGFELGDLEFGDSWVANAFLSLQDIGGLVHQDKDSNFSFYLNGSVAFLEEPVEVPEPGNLSLLLVLGLAVRFMKARWLIR